LKFEAGISDFGHKSVIKTFSNTLLDNVASFAGLLSINGKTTSLT